MSNKKNIYFEYNTVTKKWIDFIGNAVDTPESIREIISGSDLVFPTFSKLLFRAMLNSYPCEIAQKLIKILQSSSDVNEISRESEAVLKNGASAFKVYCEEYGEAAKADPTAFVFAFLNENCRRKETKICHSCTCRHSFADGLSAAGKADRNLNKNISNWLSDKNLPKERESYIAMCHALNMRITDGNSNAANNRELAVTDANRFLTTCCNQSPLQPSDPYDAAHYFSLCFPLGEKLSIGEKYDGYANYCYACKLYHDLMSVLKKNRQVEDGVQTIYLKDYILNCKSKEDFLKLAVRSGLSEEKTYNTARSVLENILDEYNDRNAMLIAFATEGDKELYGINDENRIKPLNKGLCRKTIAAICECDGKALSDSSLREFLDKNLIENVLFHSRLLHDACKANSKIDREVFLLALMVENYFVIFKKFKSHKKIINVQVADNAKTEFASFVNRINTTLISSSFAPLNPHKPFDFCILFAYHLLKFDETQMELDDCLSAYLLKAIDKVIASSE